MMAFTQFTQCKHDWYVLEGCDVVDQTLSLREKYREDCRSSPTIHNKTTTTILMTSRAKPTPIETNGYGYKDNKVDRIMNRSFTRTVLALVKSIYM